MIDHSRAPVAGELKLLCLCCDWETAEGSTEMTDRIGYTRSVLSKIVAPSSPTAPDVVSVGSPSVFCLVGEEASALDAILTIT
jgi:hypothetical protein